jgi:hypothetical protein
VLAILKEDLPLSLSMRSDNFRNTMYFSTGELVFNSNFKNKYPDRRSGLNATEVISYQYLGMTKIAV